MSDAAAHARAAFLLDVMERGLDAEVADAPSEARDWVDAYVLLFCGRFAEALEAVASVDDGSEPARAARAQIEALCTGTVTVSLQASGDAATLAGAMATFQLSEAAHIVGAIDECVRMLRSALTGRVPVRARVWLRLALVRALLFRGELGAAADELALAARDARAPQARRSVRCLRALVEGFAGRSEAVVAEAVALRREILPARTYADSGMALTGALGLANAGMVLAAGELLRDGGGGPGLPLLPPALRGYAYDVLVEAALAENNADLAAWIMVDFDRIDFSANPQFRAAREAARARIEIASGRHGSGRARAGRAAREALTAGSGLVGARATAVAAGDGPEGARSFDLLDTWSRELGAWVDRVARTGSDARVRERRPDDRADWERLTRAQQAVARLASQGMRNHEIADALVLSPRTVEGHLSAIFDRLGVSGRLGILRRTAEPDIDPSALALLTPRQSEIARALVAGSSNADIAAALGIGLKTVEKHVGGVYRALGVGGRAAAVVRLVGKPSLSPAPAVREPAAAPVP